jgi:YesN/AraC family two-component response regulator
LSAANGKEALTVFTRPDAAVDLVITDIMMPGMDGMELIKALRRIDPYARIVASSGLDQELAGHLRAAELKELRVSAFLAKPYTAESLLTVLHNAFGAAADAAREELVGTV